MLIGAIVLGLYFPMYISQSTWHIIVFIYVLIASVAPVWALLQPRDYLNSYLLVAMILAAIVGVFVAQPDVNLPAFTSFVVNGQSMFPCLLYTSKVLSGCCQYPLFPEKPPGGCRCGLKRYRNGFPVPGDR